ncbi:MAG: NifB/NifX family molybdenum-iron cluster-binding protein [Acidobacteria bacterium]|nr:NifB/NifX family molybdenum-iron cluster-binding protein [Acidobacteriota bacterium]
MIIAITAQGEALESEVDSRFGRANQFIIFNTDDGNYTVEDNKQNLNSDQGAGIQSAEKIVKSGAQVLLTGHCGPKAFKVLQAAGVEVIVDVTGKIMDAINKYKAGELKAVDKPDVEGHWG